MPDNIIEIRKLPSGSTAIATQAGDTIGLEIGSNCIFLEPGDLFEFIRLIKKVDLHFMKEEPCT